MIRKVFTQETIDKVINLRQKGYSWLKIQKEMEIPRRAAKRLYGEWEQSQSLEDLKTARKDVAAEELRKHLDTLVDFAEFLVGSLDAPKSPNEDRPAETVFDELLKRHIHSPPEPHRTNRIAMARIERRIPRQNRMLLKSLQEHTGRKANWKVIEEWKQNWNDCIATLTELKKKTNDVTGNYLKLNPGFEDKLLKETGRKDAIERILEAVLQAAWWGATMGSMEKEDASFIVPPNEKNKVIFGQNKKDVRLTLPDAKLAEDVARICTQTTKNIFLEGITDQLRARFNAIENKVLELEEMLDPLVLRPLILRNQCGLCPV